METKNTAPFDASNSTKQQIQTFSSIKRWNYKV